jgi:transposase
MKAYSQDLRERIVKAVVEDRMKKAQAARHFKVSLNTVKRYVKQRETEGQLAAKPIPGRPPQL